MNNSYAEEMAKAHRYPAKAAPSTKAATPSAAKPNGPAPVEQCVAPVAPGPTLPHPQLVVSVRPLDDAVDLLDAALHDLRRAQEVQWKSIAAESYRWRVYEVIQMVRRLTSETEHARQATAELQRAASAAGHGGYA